MLLIHGAFNNKEPVSVLEQQITLLFYRNILQGIGSYFPRIRSRGTGGKHFMLEVKFSSVLKVLSLPSSQEQVDLPLTWVLSGLSLV